MFEAVSRTKYLYCSLPVIIMTVMVFAAPVSHAASCEIKIDGTEVGSAKACIGDLDKLFVLTTRKIASRTEKGEAPSAEERTALTELIKASQRLLSVNAIGSAKDRIVLQADSLTNLLKTYHRSILAEANRTELDLTLKLLSRELFTWIAGSKMDSISETAKELNSVLTDTGYEDEVRQVFTAGTPNEFSSLVGNILTASSANSTAALIAFSNKLENFARTNTASIDANNDQLYKALFSDLDENGGLVPRLLEWENKRFATAVDRRTKSLTALLKVALVPEKKNEDADQQAMIEQKAKLNSDALNTIETVALLQTLRAHINELTDAGESKIHIIGAWFGHIGQRWSQGNQCSATSAMRARCERQADCSGPDTTGKINAASLCGYDPAPVARGKARGLVVRYTCENGGRKFWDKLVSNPLINPMTKKRYTRDESITTVLRSATSNIRCSFPAESQQPK